MKILITYQYFLPAYKAGGPVQSINNTAKLLSSSVDTEVYILCSNADLDGTISDVDTNIWTQYAERIKVFYSDKALTKSTVHEIIDSIKPDVIYINGLYSLPFTVYPLLYKPARKILSVRGMLHPGALSQKKTKKKIFLTVFKLLGLHRKCEYHATAPDEVKYIESVFGKKNKIWMIPNPPNALDYLEPIDKKVGELKLVSISLISPMKNIKLVLQALKNCTSNISYDIYGPIKDTAYWNECVQLIPTLNINIQVTYKGEIEPSMVSRVLKNYHYFILPSKSENFGHAIFEALSSGRPVITSHNTPWNGLEEANAGFNLDPEDVSSFSRLLGIVSSIYNSEYNISSKCTRRYVNGRMNLKDLSAAFQRMFKA